MFYSIKDPHDNLVRVFLCTFGCRNALFYTRRRIILRNLLCNKLKIRNFALEKERNALASAIKLSQKERL